MERTDNQIDPDVYARRWRILPVLCLSLMIIMISNGSLNVARPAPRCHSRSRCLVI